MDFQGVWGAKPPEARENIKKISEKQGKPENFENFPEFLVNFDFKMIILIKN